MKRFITAILLTALCTSLQARQVIPLNEGWRFFFKSENSSDNARHITLPHSWNTDPTAVGSFLETTGNYQNDIFIPQDCATKRVFIRFYGVQSVADLFINGSHVGQHRGGSTAFTFEITKKLRFGVDNALQMVVSNNYNPDVLPTSTDMNLYGGIYRDVELIITDQVAISPLYLGSEGVLIRQSNNNPDSSEGEVELYLSAPTSQSSCVVNLDVIAPSGKIVFNRRQKVRIDGDKPIMIPYQIENPSLWSPSTPALYQFAVSIDEGAMTDQVTVRTGLRTISVSPQGGFMINGTRLPLRGVALNHDNAISGGTLTAEDYNTDLRQIQLLGANAIRSVVSPHAQYLYDRCDELGLINWIESPLNRAPFLGDMAYYCTTQFEQNGMQQLREIIAQNINHPSTAIWGIFSLLSTRGDDAIPYIRRLNELAHQMDPTRPTAACSDQDGAINFITDLIVWQQEVGWSKGTPDDLKIWRNLMQKSWSHLRSGVCYGQSGFIGHRSYTTQTPPQINWTPEERQTAFHEEYAKNLQGDSLFWGVWINNMYDYGSARRPYGVNSAGLVTINRRDFKDAFYLYKALWNKNKPTLHITGKRQNMRSEDQMQKIKVYSSVGTPLLLLNNDTIPMREYAACQYIADSLAPRKGRVRIFTQAAELRDSVIITVGNALKPMRSPVLRRTIGQ